MRGHRGHYSISSKGVSYAQTQTQSSANSFFSWMKLTEKAFWPSRLLWGGRACPHLHKVMSVCLTVGAEVQTQQQIQGEFILTFW